MIAVNSISSMAVAAPLRSAALCAEYTKRNQNTTDFVTAPMQTLGLRAYQLKIACGVTSSYVNVANNLQTELI